MRLSSASFATLLVAASVTAPPAVGLIGLSMAATAADLGAGVAEEIRPLGYSMAELKAAFPEIPEDELPLIVFRIPTIHSIMQAYRKAHDPEHPDAKGAN